MAAATILDAHFARPGAAPEELAWAFHDVPVPIHHNEHIAAACAPTGDRSRRPDAGWCATARTGAGRWSGWRCSRPTGPRRTPPSSASSACSQNDSAPWRRALKRRLDAESLVWLADRVTGWGRVYVVEALCEVGAGTDAGRSWLLRRACDGEFLNGYFAGKAAVAAHLHEAVAAEDADDELIDHTGRLLAALTTCEGMGMTLKSSPSAHLVLDAHSRHLARRPPTRARCLDAAHIADHLLQERFDWPESRRQELLARYMDVLHRPDWDEAVRAAADPGSDYFTWFATTVAARLDLPAFRGRTES